MEIKEICEVSIPLRVLEDFMKNCNYLRNNCQYTVEVIPPKCCDLDYDEISELKEGLDDVSEFDEDLQVNEKNVKIANFIINYDFEFNGKFYKPEFDFKLYWEHIYEYFDTIIDKIIISNNYSSDEEYLAKWGGNRNFIRKINL
jgi:hypothetical protein